MNLDFLWLEMLPHCVCVLRKATATQLDRV